MPISVFHTHITDEAKKNVNEVLASTWLNEGRFVAMFESELEKLGLVRPLLLKSCTAALHLALICSGVKPGDEVILPAQTFIATGVAVLMVCAKPIFVDINPRTGNIDPLKVRERVTAKTKAVIAVHWGGLPADLDSLSGLNIIEDAAHAFGATYNSRPIGSISKFTCFSFQAIKFVTTGDGGAICTTDEDAYHRLRRMRWFGLDKTTLTRTFEGDRDCSVEDLGFKYHMNDLAAAMGVGNLSGVGTRLARRREIATIYNDAFNQTPGITLLETGNSEPSFWLFTMLVENRRAFIEKMRSHGICVSVVDRRIDAHPVFGGLTPGLIAQEFWDEHQISIPVHDALTNEEVALIVKSVNGGW